MDEEENRENREEEGEENMGLRERMETLDQAVLAQFESLTQKANRELGWTKYDLKRVADEASGASFAVAGVYSALTGIFSAPVFSGTQLESTTLLSLAAGVFDVGAAYFLNNLTRKVNDYAERVELELAHHGTAIAPEIEPSRPLYFMALPLLLGLGQYSARGAEVQFPDGTLVGASALFKSMGAVFYAAAGIFLFQICSNYLKDTTMIPPAAEKKSFFKTLYQRATAAIMPKPQPEKVPVSTVDYTTLPEVTA